MTLIIENDAVERTLTMRSCIDALETAFREYATGGAVNRPRSHTYTDVGDGRHYLFKSMDGAIQSLGVHAIRLSSDLTHEFERGGKRRRAFCQEFSRRLGQEVRPVASGREAVEGADIVALATNSQDPVIDGAWLAPGQHIGSVQGRELAWGTLERADLVGVRSREEATFHFADGHAPVEAAERKRPDERITAKMAELGDIVSGKAGRTASYTACATAVN